MEQGKFISDARLNEVIFDLEGNLRRLERTCQLEELPPHLQATQARFYYVLRALRELQIRRKQEANARRIVACVNARGPFDTERLEEMKLGGLCEMLAMAGVEIDKFRRQRDQLLALVKRYRNETPIGHQPHMICHLADELIAEVEQQK